MLRHFCLGLLLLSLYTAPLSAQFEPHEATVGVPYTFDYGAGLSDIPPFEDGFEFSYSFTVDGGTAPPGLTLKPSGLLSGTPTTAGSYTFSIRWTFFIRVDGQSYNFSQSFPVVLVVAGGTGSRVFVEPAGLSFSSTVGAAGTTQYLNVVNQSATPRPFTATASVTSGGAWLSIAGGAGDAPAFGQGTIAVSTSPSGLAAGTYFGRIEVVVSGTPTPFSVPVVLTVSSAQQKLLLSQTGLTFRASAGGGAPPAQSFSVLNEGANPIDWTVTASTLSGGAAWLSATPAGGRSDTSSAPAVQVRINPAGLAAGDYYGQVRVSAPNVPNSPQSVSVVLTVLPANVTLDPEISPTGLIFVGQAGGANPAARTVSVTNLGSTPLSFSTTAIYEQGSNWLSTPARGGTIAGGQTANISVQAAIGTLAAGVYRGEFDIRFTESGLTRRIDVVLVVVPRASSAIKTDGRFADGCAPARLIPVFTRLGASFSATGAWPTAIEVTAVDDCGTAMTSGAVAVSFSNGDPVIALTNLRDGRWTGTWQPRNATGTPVTVIATALQAGPPRIEGKATIGGNVAANTSAPAINESGAVSAFSFVKRGPLAPGSFAAIYGTHLSQGLTISPGSVFETDLNGTQALLGGRLLPLHFASDGQINAIIPYDLPPNATHQLIVRRGNIYSVPEPVTIATAQPAIITANSQGFGLAVVHKIEADGSYTLVGPDNRVTAGDYIVIYCGGLGAVTPEIAAGTPAPLTELYSTVNPAEVTIGGKSAGVQFAGLSPGWTGLYQVNAQVPEGLAPSDAAAIVITVDGQSSAEAVTIPVR
jgi:uncharacterized protein (TIGR03437 family)